MLAPSSFVVETVKRLDEENAASVIRTIKDKVSTTCGVSKMISNVRTHYLTTMSAREQRPDLKSSISRLVTEANTSGNQECIRKVNDFAISNPKQQYDSVRYHKRRPFCDNEQVNDALKRVNVLPEHVRQMKLTTNEDKECRNEQKNALVKKNSRVTHINDATMLYEQMKKIMDEEKKSVVRLAISLMFFSGRRSTEILNLRSTFEKIENMPFHCTFTGQLKKHDPEGSNDRYTIPLICDVDTFMKAVARLRSMRSQKAIAAHRQREGEHTYTNKQIAKKYSSQMHYTQKNLFSFLNKSHDLRTVYVLFVDKMFAHTLALPVLCMLVLGHDDMTESIHYSSFKVANIPAIHNGELQHTLFPQYSEFL